MVGISQGSVAPCASSIMFQLIVAGADGLDFDQTFTCQDVRIKCERPGTFGQEGSFGVINTKYPNVQCVKVE